MTEKEFQTAFFKCGNDISLIKNYLESYKI
jgi:hypothetical protein